MKNVCLLLQSRLAFRYNSYVYLFQIHGMIWNISRLLICLCFSITSLGQSKIEGIGQFKIDRLTKSQFLAIVTSNGYKLAVIRSKNESYYYTTSKHTIYELQPDSLDIENSPSKANFCAETTVFFLSDTIIAGIRIEKIFLTFFKDTLANIQLLYSDEIAAAFKLKYGEPIIDSYIFETQKKCPGSTKTPVYNKKENKSLKSKLEVGQTDEVTFKDTLVNHKWKDNNTEIQLYGYIFNQCDGKPINTLNFYISNTSKANYLTTCNKSTIDRLKQKAIDASKKKLDDF